MSGPTSEPSPLVARMEGIGTTIFATMSEAAAAHDAVNLGQGFPDDDPPAPVIDAAVAAMHDGQNQYAPGIGMPELRQAVADHQQRFWGLSWDPDAEVTVCNGATEGVAAAILALCEPGDEVVLFEPWYDAYRADVALAGGVHRSVPLPAPDFRIDEDRLAAAIGDRTRLVVFNSPHNPTGRVFSDEELDAVARVCIDNDLTAITDEPYEHLVYDGAVHRPFVSRPGMRERTVSVSSAAKSFSATGWKIGWITAPPPLTDAVRATKQWLTFTTATPLQLGIAAGLTLPDSYFADLAVEYTRRRDRLRDGLVACGFRAPVSEGTYFLTVDVRDVGAEDGTEFCETMLTDVGVAAIPEASFHDDGRGASLVRFACCKSATVLDEGVRRLMQLAR